MKFGIHPSEALNVWGFKLSRPSAPSKRAGRSGAVRRRADGANQAALRRVRRAAGRGEVEARPGAQAVPSVLLERVQSTQGAGAKGEGGAGIVILSQTSDPQQSSTNGRDNVKRETAADSGHT